ncbi:MAG: diaminopimelate epimerase [Chlorobi bacterium]|nr:diaminopimelate epimerase [Chlorobiota bacterium]
MKISFYKYQGNGNDFIIIDDRKTNFKFPAERIASLCDRHFGIGADGLMLLRESGQHDFSMLYYNSDGHPAGMCGNGGRCIAAFAFQQGIAGKKMIFDATDGTHEAVIDKVLEEGCCFDVSLKMNDVEQVEKNKGYYFLNTGVPHYVEFVDKVAEVDVEKEGRKTRFSEIFAPEGTNVNFVELNEDRIFVRTYERGVEGETLSCGTGVTASAIAAYLETGKKDYPVHTTGGEFSVIFREENGRFTDVWLRGPVEMVFKGDVQN